MSAVQVDVADGNSLERGNGENELSLQVDGTIPSEELQQLCSLISFERVGVSPSMDGLKEGDANSGANIERIGSGSIGAEQEADKSLGSVRSKILTHTVAFVDKLFGDRLNESRPRSSASYRQSFIDIIDEQPSEDEQSHVTNLFETRNFALELPTSKENREGTQTAILGIKPKDRAQSIISERDPKSEESSNAKESNQASLESSDFQRSKDLEDVKRVLSDQLQNGSN